MNERVTPKSITFRQRVQVGHYLWHGDQSCRRCRQGFDVYWITFRGNIPVKR